MKKLTASVAYLFILSLLFVNLRYSFFSAYMSTRKAEFRSTLITSNSGSTKQITYSSLELYENAPGREWKEHNKELVLNGVYHEVVKVRPVNGRYVVTYIEDRAENEIFAKYFQKTSKNEAGINDAFSTFLSLQFTEEQQSFRFLQFEQKHTHIKDFQTRIPSFAPGDTLKPPRLS